jgi:arylsulfatase A-like enzyme
VGQVLDTLEAEGRMNKTYVVLTADHGQAFGEHGNKLHGRTVYEEETNVPLMVWGPGIAAGTRKEPVAVLDTFPTVLELAGLGQAPHTCATSLAPWLRDPKIGAGRDIFIEKIPDERKEFAVAYVHGWHKLVVSPNSCSMEVFDLRKDRGDRSDLSDNDPALTHQLLKSLRAFQKQRGMNPNSYCLE